jgi:hypothetical protein
LQHLRLLQVDGKGADQEQVRAVAAQPFVSFVHVAAKRGAGAADVTEAALPAAGSTA